MTRPRVTLVVPGTWRRVDLAQDPSTDLNAAMGDVEAPGAALLGVRLELLARMGGDMLMMRTRTDEPTVIVTAWPPAGEAGTGPGEESLGARLREELGPDAVEAATTLVHPFGYALVRVPNAAFDGAVGWTYWMSHPDTGRVLLIDVTMALETVTDEQVARYDRTVQHVRWDESPR